MKIGITSQNFRTITGHAGKTRRFLIFGQDETGRPLELQRLDLPKTMSLHAYHGSDHPIFQVDLLVCGSCGQGFIQRMAAHGVQVIPTREEDPVRAAKALFAGETLPPPAPHDQTDGVDISRS
ncbi:MAG: NifB/NifX family molybdenum-iron cluster-binding protein [Gammaproteobacteria bacterium]|nr:NifB/NifX family molybdenum-iron cluster-binding protein [Gammaproteobacteria bacterium]